MKTISIFYNKGGVGKTTLTYHLAHALARMGKRVLILDLDPQCNITALSLPQDWLLNVWEQEDPYIEDFKNTRERDETAYKRMNEGTRTVHYLLAPTQEGTADLETLPPPVELARDLHLIPGRLTMHLYEDKISSRWSDVYQGDPLAIRTVTKIRELAERYSKLYNYDFVIMDTSPSLGALNKVIISTTDGFLIPCAPDMFSLYGIRNLGNALSVWQKQFNTIYQLLSEEKRKQFPERFVSLLGFTIYNAKKYTGVTEWDLAKAHYNYAKKIPEAIIEYIPTQIRGHIDKDVMATPVGEKSIMHTHNTLTGMSQKYHLPMWDVPNFPYLGDDYNTVVANKAVYESTLEKYVSFAGDLLSRVSSLG
ncbi:ParA family protein [Pseudomonas aeruginosa]|uniref:ParA family protein n=1 Tax=Pseudomonas aeruginosa TaxID=287 RepID=UPI003CF34204